MIFAIREGEAGVSLEHPENPDILEGLVLQSYG